MKSLRLFPCRSDRSRCRQHRAGWWLVWLLWLPMLALAAEPAVRPAPGLQAELERLLAGFDGQVGVQVLALDDGRAAGVNAQTGFPMASTVKVPVAVHILSLVDAGRLDLQQQVLLKEGDIYPGMGGPIDTHLSAGSAITVRDLLHMMLTVSDNNATDILIKLGGGPQAVQARLRALGIDGIRVDRYIWEMLAHYYGDDTASARDPLSPQAYARLEAQPRSDEQRRQLRARYEADPRDTATPQAMATLLARIWRGQVLQPAMTAVLQQIMRDCLTGEHRLKGLLPEGTVVAHKTGTVGSVANDVGVIDLPAGRGQAVVAVYVKSPLAGEDRDRIIAELARATHDYLLFSDRP